MFSVDDTIVAIATPSGRGGIGVVRLSGAGAHAIALGLLGRTRELEPRRAAFSRLRVDRCGSAGAPVVADEVVTTYFPGPRSYTGEDVVEISGHGSPVILRHIVDAAIARGGRLAEPGEFTLRAYLNGRIDLTQAEAVADLIDAVTPLQARTAFDQLEGTLTRAIGTIDTQLFDLIARLEASVDFPDEGYHFADPARVAAEIGEIAAHAAALLASARGGRFVREGLQVAIVGAPNVGKSTLFNALLGADRAIVTDVPGTTRDLVTETMDLDGLKVTLVDTAGIRETNDLVEMKGVARSRDAVSAADLVLLVIDASRPASELDLPAEKPVLVVANKSDLVDSAAALNDAPQSVVSASARSGAGLVELRRRIAVAVDVEPLRDVPAITNVRHAALVGRAHEALLRAKAAASTGPALAEEFVLADLQEARAAFEEVTGKRAPEDLLAHIFSNFCIGK